MQIPKNSSAKLLYYYPSGNRTRKTGGKGNIAKTRYYLGDYELYKRTVSGATDYQRQTTTLSDGEKVFARIEQLDYKPPVVRYQFDNHLGSASLELDTALSIALRVKFC